MFCRRNTQTCTTLVLEADLCDGNRLTPVHDDVPNAAVDTVDACKHDEQCHHFRCSLNAEETQSHAREDGKAVLSTIDQVREHITGIVVTSQTLKRAPDAGNRREETEKPGVRAVTHRWLIPVARVQAEEKLEMAHRVR